MGPGDDAAVVDGRTAVTADALIEGVHFDDRCAAADVGFKTLAVSVSDLAAMGARPRWAVLSLAVPADDGAAGARWVEGFAEGLATACHRWEVALVGGDTVRSPGPRAISLTLAGELVGRALHRSGARPGDEVWVTGTLGLAGQGWRHAAPSPEAREAWRRPDPPLAFALALAAAGLATAALDLSDGLAVDAGRLAAASGVALQIVRDALPCAPGDDAVIDATRGGEDYQLLFTASPADRAAIEALGEASRVRLTRIGAVTEGQGAHLSPGPWPAPVFAHFPAEATP